MGVYVINNTLPCATMGAALKMCPSKGTHF